MSYQQHIFYNHTHMSLEQKVELMREAKELAYEWWVDILDCSVSWARQRVEMKFDEILKKFDNECHFFFIHRRGFLKDEDDFIETGYRTMTDPDYFLWINMKLEKLPYFVKKYNLTTKP